MKQGRRHTLWLLLPREAHERYQALIAKLSARCNTLAFEPHVTLLNGLAGDRDDLRRRTRALAEALAPFEARLLEVAWRDEYYRCLFVEVVRSRALLDAHALAGKIFDKRVETDFYPHLSLVYGDLDENQKGNIANDVGRHIDERLTIGELALYDTGGATPAAWRCVERCHLGQTAVR
ncbi:MAG: 2'-5' RNA ligase family protein [Bacteroidota bacterium]